MKWLSGTALLLSLLLANSALGKPRIVALSPHLTEWVYSLKMGDALVGASAYSDYPAQAESIPRVADYNGVNFRALMALSPDIVLAWQGGNKPQDIARLKQLGYTVFLSSVHTPDDIPDELEALGNILDKNTLATTLATDFREALARIRAQYQRTSPTPVFYYSWTSPLMTVGENAWPNHLLATCGAETIFSDAPNDYPQVSVQEVLKRQPALLIAATKASAEQAGTFWQPHHEVLDAPLMTVDPDITSRFTLRLLPALRKLCEGVSEVR